MDLLNKVMVVGNLTGDPEVRETGNGKLVANFCLAIDPPGGGGRDGGGDSVFLDVVLWEGMAENASKYLKKGSGVLVEGRLQMDRWKDKESGQARTKLKAVGERMRFLGGAGRGDREEQAGGQRPRGSSHREPAVSRR